MAAADIGAESVLGDSSGEDSAELRRRCDLALRYLANAYKAIRGADNEEVWRGKIDPVFKATLAAYGAMDPADIFPGKRALALYDEAALMYPGLWRELMLSADTLPEPSLLGRLANVFDAAAHAPGFLIERITDALSGSLGRSVASIWSNLWPVIVVGGAVGLVYVLRGPLAAIAMKLGDGVGGGA